MTAHPLQIVVAGATGRMGEAVVRLALTEPGLVLAGLLVRKDDPGLGHTPYQGGPPLKVLAESQDGDLRRRAIMRLAEPSDAKDREHYITILATAARSERDAVCRLAAVQQLATYKDPVATKALVDAYPVPSNSTDMGGMVQIAVVDALGKRKDPAAMDTLIAALDSKNRRLRDFFGGVESVIVAFSGGVDSTFLAWAATQALGSSALCVTADSPSYPDRHRRLALDAAHRFGLHHLVIHTRELELPDYRANPVNRCYYCKHELYTALSSLASQRGIQVIADGSNADDRRYYGERQPKQH